MEPITFSARPSQKMVAAAVWAPVLAITSLAAFNLSWEAAALLSSTVGSLDTIAALRIAMAAFAVMAIPVTIAAAVLAARRAGPERNFLQITQAGLSYMRHGEARFWGWGELSGFNAIPRYRHIEFALPSTGSKATKRDRWVHEIGPDGPIAVIQDIYDASLDDIAATLNTHHKKVIGNQG